MKEKALRIVHKLRREGFEAYFVGGCVRDRVARRIRPELRETLETKDYDVATNAPLRAVRDIFGSENHKFAGESFGVSLVGGIEVAGYRCDLHGVDHSWETQPTSSLREDLARRDLTINSMAMNPRTGEVIDPSGGTRDIREGVIRFNGSPDRRIDEDPVRMIRAVRFAAKLEFTIASSDSHAIMQNHFKLRRVPLERLRLELMKAMELPGVNAALFVEKMQYLGLLSWVLPSLSATEGVEGGQHHNESVFVHNVAAGMHTPTKCPLVRLAALLHDVGKAATILKDPDGQISFHGHEHVGEQLVARDLKRLKFPTKEWQFVSRLVGMHMRTLEGSGPKGRRRLLRDLRERDLTWRDYVRMRIADRSGNLAKKPFGFGDIKRIILMFDEMHEARGSALSVGDLMVSGRDVMEVLGIGPGPQVGAVLRRLFEEVLDNPSLNSREQLLSRLRDPCTVKTA